MVLGLPANANSTQSVNPKQSMCRLASLLAAVLASSTYSVQLAPRFAIA